MPVNQSNAQVVSSAVTGNSGDGGHAWSISAVVAVYNPDPELFRKAVASVLGQTLPVLELILVNDGGSEAFRQVLPDDARVRVFSKPNEGVAATRNFAIAQCRGEYIAFLDQDDLWYPEKLASQTSLIAVPGERCMVISPVDIVDASGQRIEKRSSRALAKYRSRTAGKDLVLGLADDNFIYSSTPLVHREVFQQVGGFDAGTKPHDDWDMYLRIVMAGVTVYACQGEALSVWRLHESNESGKRMSMMQSKCVVEEKALRTAPGEDVAKILRSNIALDRIIMGNLLYNAGDFSGFRKSMHIGLPELMKLQGRRGRSDRYADEFRKRARKLIMKSVRRYLLSFIPVVRG